MNVPTIHENCPPLTRSTRIWWVGLAAACATGALSQSSLAALLVFLPFHLVACSLLARAARLLGASPWLFGALAAVAFPLYFVLSTRLRWRAWEVV